MKLLPVLVLLSLVAALPAAAQKKMTRLSLVVQNENGDPVPRAGIVFRTLKGKKLRKIGETFQLRTSIEGTAPLPPVQQGFALVQIIAEGYQTFGDRIELNEPEQTVTITLKPPQDQVSVHPNDGSE